MIAYFRRGPAWRVGRGLCMALAAFLFFGAGSAALGKASDLTRNVFCKNIPQGVPTGTIVVDLERFSIPADWDEGGAHYEITTVYDLTLFLPDDPFNPLCKYNGHWGTREYPKILAQGNRWKYPLDLTLVIHDVPIKGSVDLYIHMREEDDTSQDDTLDLHPSPVQEFLALRLYPARKQGHLLTGGGIKLDDPSGLLQFGKSKRFVGDGSRETVLASITVKVDGRENLYSPSAPGDAKKVGGAVSCPLYGTEAVNLTVEASKLGCGFKPPEWSTDYQHHVAWCLRGNNLAQAKEANARRRKELEGCKAKLATSAKDKTCRTYALTAVKHNQQAAKLGCGFKPPVWSNDHQMHFDWCMRGNNSKLAGNENKKRQQKVTQCQTAKPAKPKVPAAAQYCQTYAQTAINQFHTAQSRNCGFVGPEWSLDYNWHYKWCVQMHAAGNLQAINAGTALRSSKLAGCN